MSDETQVPAQTLEALLAAHYPNLRRAQRAQAEAKAMAPEEEFSIQENTARGVYRLQAMGPRPDPAGTAPDPDPKADPKADPDSRAPDPVRMKATATTTASATAGKADAGGNKTQGRAAAK